MWKNQFHGTKLQEKRNNKWYIQIVNMWKDSEHWKLKSKTRQLCQQAHIDILYENIYG